MRSADLDHDKYRILVTLIKDASGRNVNVSVNDELYYDLKIYGDPLFDLFEQLASDFGTDFSKMNINNYAPGEGASVFKPLLVRLGFRPFKSLKVKDIWKAIEHGYWE